MQKHADRFLKAAELGSIFPAYQPTVMFPGQYIDSFHELIGASAKGSGLVDMGTALGVPVKGWLRRADALKLYELGYFANGDILELGSYHGLSTCILSKANHNAEIRQHIDSIDLDPQNCKKTSESLRAAGLAESVEVHCSDAAQAVMRLAADHRQFEFVFIDHSHAYQPVYNVCRGLAEVVNPGGFCLFHDFNDRRNADPAETNYDVYRAVTEGLDPKVFEFYGIYGCTALYRKQ